MRAQLPVSIALLCLSTSLLAACGSEEAPPGTPQGDNNGVLVPNNENNPIPMGPDADEDGLPDSVEDKNGNGIFDEGTTETDAQNPDTDGDGLLDGEEDVNRNGRTDPGETDPRLADTDGDTLPDGQEEGLGTDPTLADTDDDGLDDGQERTAGTNPIVADTDGDGVLDGDEDRNGDGVLDPGETDPNVQDTDGDGIPDGQENTALACARANRTPITLPTDEAGDWLLTLNAAFSGYHPLDVARSNTDRTHAAVFEAPGNGVQGLVFTRQPPMSIRDAQSQLILDTSALAEAGDLRDLRTRLDTTWDGFDRAVFRAELAFEPQVSASVARDRILAALMGRTLDEIEGLPGQSGEVSGLFTLYGATIYRGERRVLTLAALASSDAIEQDEAIAFAARDVGDGTALAQRDDGHVAGCDPLEPAIESFDVDLLWVVDRSLSMNDDQEAVAAAADAFFATIANTDLDFRMGVTSSDNRQNLWTIEETGFSAEVEPFREAMLDPPGRDSEFGLATGLNIVRLASGNILDPHQIFRRFATRIVVFFSDEDDFDIKNALTDDDLCIEGVNPPLAGCPRLEEFIAGYRDFDVTAFAITGDPPGGCTSVNGPGQAGEAGHGYIQTALATGGSFGSICAEDLSNTFDEIIQASYGVASTYQLSRAAISATVKVVVNGDNVPRSKQVGFDYDPVNRTVFFFGDARPQIGDEIAVSYLGYEDLSPDPDPEDPIID